MFDVQSPVRQDAQFDLLSFQVYLKCNFLQKVAVVVQDKAVDRNTMMSAQDETGNLGQAQEPLLGMPKNGEMDEVELKNIEIQLPTARILSKEGWPGMEEMIIETSRGNVVVGVQGRGRRHTMLTYHDIGMNYISNFQTFFNYIDMRIAMETFTVYHVTAPGQEENATSLSETFVYPTMDELAAQLEEVCQKLSLKNFIGLGVGFGANILARFGINHPGSLDALCLVNCVSTQSGWIEWGYQKMNIRSLRNAGSLTANALEYLLWHHFGKAQETRNHDLVQVYRQYFADKMNPHNLSLLLETYITRSDLGIQRLNVQCGAPPGKGTLAMPVLLITGHYSPHVEDTVTLNSRLDPSKSSWLKLSDCGMPLEERPEKVCEALRLFLQGAGFIPTLSQRKLSRSRSIESGDVPHVPTKDLNLPVGEAIKEEAGESPTSATPTAVC
ncbi:unnamed protein product [Notodromas monacha]|uniref:Protein NDRG3 n=1 Tax=Notodromas monacha TaxID=399045 RepID=A0A7R9BGT3_9CRUS|nr:unnamed protein product [Notodromas monacha]CAG0914115.1 unnamed protein product [Notodromas monacha]